MSKNTRPSPKTPPHHPENDHPEGERLLAKFAALGKKATPEHEEHNSCPCCQKPR